MSEAHAKPIIIKANELSASVGELHTRSFTPLERMGRAGKALAIAWLLALVTVFIPIAHFVLVPLFVIAGPVMAFARYRVETVVEKARGICPECAHAIDIPLDPADKLPKWSYCPDCNKPLQLI